MNSVAERWIRTVRQEALDYFIIFNQKQLRNILKKFIMYYNCLRPHQAASARKGRINQNVPQGYILRTTGRIKSKPILSGLHHHYFREAA